MNAAVDTLEKRLETVSERARRAKGDMERAEATFGVARDYYRKLEQEEMDLSAALEELSALQQEGLIRG